MERVAADTNIYVSALNFGGKPLQLLELARAGAVHLAISDEIVAEVGRVLAGKFDWEAQRVEQAVEDLAAFTERVTPSQPVAAVKDDPADDRILECAVAAGSSVIVSGDKHLLRLAIYRGMPIIRVADFLDHRFEQSRSVTW